MATKQIATVKFLKNGKVFRTETIPTFKSYIDKDVIFDVRCQLEKKGIVIGKADYDTVIVTREYL